MRAWAMHTGASCTAALLLFGALAGVSGRRLERQAARVPAGDEVVYLPEARLLRPLVLGYETVLADILWFRTINYFGAHYTTDRAYPWLARMCDIVTDLDPRAEHVYQFGGVILPWEAKDPDAGIRLLEKGIAAFPESWRLPYHLGIVYYLFKNDDAAAAAHLAAASRLPGAPPLVGRVAALLHARQHGPEITLGFLRHLRESASSAEMRDVLDRSIVEAQAALDLERLGELASRYRAEQGRWPATVAAMVEAGLLRAVPPDPFGGSYEVDPGTGTVRSSTGRTPLALHASPVLREVSRGAGGD